MGGGLLVQRRAFRRRNCLWAAHWITPEVLGHAYQPRGSSLAEPGTAGRSVGLTLNCRGRELIAVPYKTSAVQIQSLFSASSSESQACYEGPATRGIWIQINWPPPGNSRGAQLKAAKGWIWILSGREPQFQHNSNLLTLQHLRVTRPENMNWPSRSYIGSLRNLTGKCPSAETRT
jgi:hypothetical protein